MLVLHLPLTTKTTSAQPTPSDHWNHQKPQLQKGMQLKGQWSWKPPTLAFPDIIMGSGAANCRTTVDHLPGGRLLAGGEFDCCSFYSTAFISCGRPQDAHSAENKNRSKRKRCEVWGENPKQNDWRRAGDWPVGMKNIGNTCWFSAVIQVISKKSSLISNLLWSWSQNVSQLEVNMQQFCEGVVVCR